MTNSMKTLLMMTVAALLGGGSVWFMDSSPTREIAGHSGDARKPLYWVAPMDPNYRRDRPGKSPMGMDMIPVYEEDGGNEGPGAVSISPDVVNNLGVRTAKVAYGRLGSEIRTVGYIQYDENYLRHVSPRVEGWIERLYVKAEGDVVKQGEPLYAIYSPTLTNAQEELLLALKRNNPDLIRASLERLEALQVPKAFIEKLRNTRSVSQTVAVPAPQSGVLDNLSVREGTFVKPGMTMMSIGNLGHIWLVGEVYERQAMQIAEGHSVRMTLDYLPGKEWTGKVDYVYPSLNSKTRTARIRTHFSNPDALLRPGMFAQIEIMPDEGAEELLIPREALIRSGTQSRVVLQLGDGRFKSIEVKPGRIGERNVEILSGLVEGDRIVTSAQFLLDSESSKTSDFKRMNHVDDVEAIDESVWVVARVVKIMPDHRMLTLEHEAIEAWSWLPMTMDFAVGADVDLSVLDPGMTLHVQIQRADGEMPRVNQIHVRDSGSRTDVPENSHEMHDSEGEKQ